jgi:hypothetical protein
MAERDIVGGLFGMTPESYQQGMNRRDSATNLTAAQLTPGQLAGFYAMEAGTGLGRATQGLLGVEDPELAKIRDVQQMRTQFDVSTPAGLNQFAQALGQKGYTDLAMQAAQRAADLEQTVATTGLRQAQAAKASEVSSVSPEQLLTSGRYTPASVAKYQTSGNIADLVLSKETKTGESKELTPEQQEAKQMDAQIAVDTVTEAKALTSAWSAGYGSLLSALPTTDARKLQGKLDTIKSNLAAAMIEDLKSQSRTGATGLGALNREELKVLQTSKASLDAGMGASELNKSLNVIDKYFRRRAGLPQVQEEKPGDKKAQTSSADDDLVNKYLKPQPKPNK